MTYASEPDPLCYPGTSILVNKAGLINAEHLEQFELAMFVIRAEEGLPEGKLDYAHYRALHHHLFQDVYEWAGQLRTTRIGKGGNWFCYPEHIDREMKRIFRLLLRQKYLNPMPADAFSVHAARYLAEINAVHPFREGNGRTQLTFLTLLAENAGFGIRDDQITRDAVIPAMIASFTGNEGPLAALIYSLIEPAKD